ncbi:hypothetical protein [Halalkalicoccus salilacus]|uniref:hypothetical protein n=1 Tax=Halalkalicoccus salilacus TaxID=3117459 RepID=UPI00300F281C
MSKGSNQCTRGEDESLFRDYIMGIRIIECHLPEGKGPCYRFEAPQHKEIMFDDPDLAELYANIYFDVNGFEEAGTGERGVPPEIIQAGRDTLAAYFLTQPGTDVNWVASFFGVRPTKIHRYVDWVSGRADEIREGAKARGLE